MPSSKPFVCPARQSGAGRAAMAEARAGARREVIGEHVILREAHLAWDAHHDPVDARPSHTYIPGGPHMYTRLTPGGASALTHKMRFVRHTASAPRPPPNLLVLNAARKGTHGGSQARTHDGALVLVRVPRQRHVGVRVHAALVHGRHVTRRHRARGLTRLRLDLESLGDIPATCREEVR